MIGGASATEDKVPRPCPPQLPTLILLNPSPDRSCPRCPGAVQIQTARAPDCSTIINPSSGQAYVQVHAVIPHLAAIGGQTGGPARPGTGPSKHGPFRHDPLKHENINRPWRACPWAEVPAQARPKIDLIGPGRPVWLGSPAARKCLNRV